ncbi:MAG: bifunctional UDP-N-acetylglucosamine diphosphorylase/glucosamine-1-phosphate N-acetyltransferase GlmU, partial [Alphaproteobacteria bacterium]
PNTTCVRQTEQLGTGHAVLQAEKALKGFTGTVLIVCGDVPLMETQALQAFLDAHQTQKNVVTAGSAVVDDPTGLGRMLRDKKGKFVGIREHKDCSNNELAIREVNVGIYAVSSTQLLPLLKSVTNKNAQKEYYLPDIISLGLKAKLAVAAVEFEQDPSELGGINNRVQLAMAEQSLQERYAEYHLLNGATLQDPATTHFSWDTQLGQDVTIEPNVYFGAGVKVADNVAIHANSYLEGCTIESGASVGPFARIRAGTTVGEDAKIGNFVETKKAKIGKGSKVSHLTYVGDVTIGSNVNVGAGTIVANYHAFRKTKAETHIADGASIGANSVLVAPVSIGKDAFVAAGTVVRKDVAAGTLVADKPEQIVKTNYKK